MSETIDQNISGLGQAAIFKSKTLKWAIVWVFIFYPIIVCAMIYIAASLVERSGFHFIVVIMGASVIVVGAFSVYGLFSESDIIADEQSISRSIFGKTWQSIRWENVRLIKAFPVPYGSVTVRAFNIYPVVKRRFHFMPAGKMVFDDTVGNSQKLVELINHHALKHGIKIETTNKLWGNPEPATRL